MNPTPVRYVLSVDIAQQVDYTAAVAIRSTTDDQGKKHHEVAWLDRIRHVPYPDQIRLIASWFQEMQLGAASEPNSTATLVVDTSGVGRPILDALREAKLKPKAVLITGGDKAIYADGINRVPKIILVTTLQICLESKRLKIKRDLPHSETLVRELRGFKVHFNAAGRAKFGNDAGEGEWRVADHDDMVLAVAMGVWLLEKRGVASRSYLKRAMGLA